jgi:hypothetical protein
VLDLQELGDARLERHGELLDARATRGGEVKEGRLFDGAASRPLKE